MDNNAKMKILIAGYGKMGKLIAQLAQARGHEVIAKIDASDTTEWAWAIEAKPDVCIEFTRPDAAFENIRRCMENGIPVISGTTGWYAQLPEIRRLASKNNGALLYASNFSIGVNILFKVNKLLASLMSHFPDYDCSLEEVHHTQKLDAPSGTAIQLAEDLLANHKDFNVWRLGAEKEPGVLPVEAKRRDDIPGIHTLTWQSPVDKVSIRHEAFNRQGFALGALMAAHWIVGKTGVYNMEDLFDSFIEGQ